MAMVAAAAVVAAPLTISTTTSPSRPSLPSSSAAAFLLLPSPPRSLHLRRPPTLAFFDTRVGSTRQRRRRLPAIVALASRKGELERVGSYEKWNEWTAKFAGAANLPFLLLQLPQILLNARNLTAGNKAALFAVPWLVTVLPVLLLFSVILI